jgi:glycosyltransferase involved in cell wall biosynthesis
VTSAVAEILERRGIDSQKIEVIENSADIGRFAEAKPTFWADFRERGYQAVGLVGRLILEKGGVEFLHAAKEVLSVLPRTIFVLVGDGPAHDVLAETSRNLRIEDAVIFAGRREDMPEVYASLDLVVLPSYAEGLPMTIIEALAARRPVVATAVGGVPRVIHDEITGLLLPDRNVGRLSEAIVRVLQDRVLGRRLAENGHQLVRERFSADSMARRYCELYSALPVGQLRRSA